MQKRKGSTWLSVQISMIVILILLAAIFFYIKNVMKIEERTLIKSECIFIAKEVLETIKYNEMYKENAPYPKGEILRNGKKYHVEINEKTVDIKGIKMKEIYLEIENEKGKNFEIRTYIGKRK